MERLGWTGRLAAWSHAHRWWVIGAWLLAVVAVTTAATATGRSFTTEIEFTNQAESQRAKESLEAFFGDEPLAETVIVRHPTLTVDDAAFEAVVGGVLADLRARPDLFDTSGSTSFFESGIPQLVSPDRRTTLIPLALRGNLDDSVAKVDTLLETLHERQRDGFVLLTGGFASINQAFNEAAEKDLASEQKAIPIALIILIIVFGAIVAALLPMGLAFVTVFTTFGLIALISQLWPLHLFVQNIVLGIGLAVGIDYALFVVERFREERRRGRDVAAAIGVAGDTASRAVLFSGAIVVIGLSGMLLVPTNIFRSFGLGASSVVLVTVAASLTLLPAVLGLLGDRVNRLGVPFLRREVDLEHERGFWAGAARRVMARPILSAVLAGGFLVVLALPVLRLELGYSGVAAIPESFQARQAFEVLDAEFSAGRLSPTQVVITGVDVNAPAVQAAIGRLVAAVEADRQLALLAPPFASPDGSLAVVSTSLPGDAASDEAIAALEHLRTELVPAAFAGTDATITVNGQTAVFVDLFNTVRTYTPIVFAFVLSLSFILLLMVFRSIVVPLKAIIMNLLSVGAAYGVIVAIFQFGWGASALGFQRADSIEAWLPLMMFTILFGLSMDYHVFLLSRIRERFDETHRNADAVAFGLRSTANIITGAAAIMVVVFGGFALGDLVSFQQMGVGLGVAILLDATVVRTVLVPSTMRLLGDWNWYLPSWLQWLPDLRVEREPAADVVPQPEPVAAA